MNPTIAEATMSSGSEDGLTKVRTDLRNLVTAQEVHFTRHRSYAASLEELMAATGFRLSPGHQGELTGDRGGFTAMVRLAAAASPPDRGTIWAGEHARKASREPLVIYCE